MSRPLRTLSILAALALAIPLIPFLAFGTRLDEAVARWLDPPPSPIFTAALEVGVLAADIVLPVPSSLVATLGGAQLGVVAGTACAWLGLTAGAIAGWWLGRATGGRAVTGLDADERAALVRRQQTLGPLLVVATRPVPLVAEAAAIMAGAAGMDWRAFLVAAGSGNLAIALVWTLAGSLGRAADSLQWALVASLIIPVALTWLVLRRSLQTPSGGV